MNYCKVVKKEYKQNLNKDRVVGYIDIVETYEQGDSESILAKVILLRDGQIGTLYFQSKAMVDETITKLIKTSREELKKVNKKIN